MSQSVDAGRGKNWGYFNQLYISVGHVSELALLNSDFRVFDLMGPFLNTMKFLHMFSQNTQYILNLAFIF